MITPRCDFAHDKTSVFNYLPIVDFEAYVSCNISRLIEREAARITAGLKSLNIPLPAFELLQIGATPDSIIDELSLQSRQPTSSKTTHALVTRFCEDVERLRELEKLLVAGQSTEQEIIEKIPKRELKSFKEQIVKNQIADIHALPPCNGASSKPLIVLLRHVCSCDIRCLQLAHSCVTENHWKDIILRHGNTPGIDQIRRKPERLARVKSPYIEHVISRYTALFSRVGVPDFTAIELKWLLQ